MGQAKLLFSYKARQGRLMIEMVLWQLPKPTPDRPHGIKYRLCLGRDGKTLFPGGMLVLRLEMDR